MKRFVTYASLGFVLLAGGLPNVAEAGQEWFMAVTPLGGQQDIVFTNTGTGGTFTTPVGGTPVSVTGYWQTQISGLPADLQCPLAAHLFLDAVATAPAVSYGYGYTRIDQPIAGTLRLDLDTPYQGKTDLLSMDFTTAISALSYGGMKPFIYNYGFVYSSDFLRFSPGTNTLSGINTLSWGSFGFPNADPVWIASDGFLTSWSGNAGAAFAADGVPTPVPVPVPGAVLLGVLGLSFAGWRLKCTTT
jgi:hypothetical protein